MICPNCGQQWGEIKLWPVGCPCGLRFTSPDDKIGDTLLEYTMEIEEGVGTEVMEMFSVIAPHTSATCNCEAIRKRMNRLGPEGCRANVGQLSSDVRNSAMNWKAENGSKPWKGICEDADSLAQAILTKAVTVCPLPPAAAFRILILRACDIVEGKEIEDADPEVDPNVLRD